MTNLSTAIGFLISLGIAASSTAQDRGQLGLTMQYPGEIGIIWHATESVAVWPTISFSRASSETAQTQPSHSRQVGTTIGGLFYVYHRDAFRTFLSPRIAYFRNTYGPAPGGEIAGSSYITTGSFGGQYTFARRLAIIAEAGIDYEHHTTVVSFSFSESGTTRIIRSHGSIAAALYF